MAKNPKCLRKHTKIKNKNLKKLTKVAQNVRQRKAPNFGKVSDITKLSQYVQDVHAKKTEHRAEIAKAAMLKLLKKQKLNKRQLEADKKNREKMERLRTVYIESQKTKKKFKVPKWKAEKYCKKWFVMSNKLAYKKQERLQRTERKTIAKNKLIKSSYEITERIYKGKKEIDGKITNVYEEVKREIEIWGLPKFEGPRKARIHNGFDGENRKQRRDSGKGQPGNRFLERQTIKVIPETIIGTEEINGKIYEILERETEEYIIRNQEPEYEYVKEEFNFYEKVENPDPMARRTHPKIKTDKVVGTIEIIKKVFKGMKDVEKRVHRLKPIYYKTILNLQASQPFAKKLHNYKVALEDIKQKAKEENEKNIQKELSEKEKNAKPNKSEKKSKSKQSGIPKETEKRRDKTSTPSEKEKGGKTPTGKRTKRAVKV